MLQEGTKQGGVQHHDEGEGDEDMLQPCGEHCDCLLSPSISRVQTYASVVKDGRDEYVDDDVDDDDDAEDNFDDDDDDAYVVDDADDDDDDDSEAIIIVDYSDTVTIKDMERVKEKDGVVEDNGSDSDGDGSDKEGEGTGKEEINMQDQNDDDCVLSALEKVKKLSIQSKTSSISSSMTSLCEDEDCTRRRAKKMDDVDGKDNTMGNHCEEKNIHPNDYNSRSRSSNSSSSVSSQSTSVTTTFATSTCGDRTASNEGRQSLSYWGKRERKRSEISLEDHPECDACSYCDDTCSNSKCMKCLSKRKMLEAREAKRKQRGCMKQVYTMCQIQRHNTKADCWLAAHKRVYDVTEFVNNKFHRGGTDIVVRFAGQEVSKHFDFHSSTARKKLWAHYCIGISSPCPGKAQPETDGIFYLKKLFNW
eukprot:m.77574 g.77574  ORF g.77574 m.77574 type:complete len:420 (-) comp8546_c0_seq1:723-1982(-)